MSSGLGVLVRGGKMSMWLVKPDGDATWSAEDWGTAATLEARWKSKGVTEEERLRLVPCAVWLKKFPGLVYSDDILERLEQLAV